MILLLMQDKFGVRSLHGREREMMAALYLQVSIVSQALIFVTRSRSWSFVERPGLLLVSAFVVAQLVSLQSRIFTGLNFFGINAEFSDFSLKHGHCLSQFG